MKRFFYSGKQILLAVCFLLASCSGTLVPDPIDPRIPKYTESGNNVAGAFVDGHVWESVVLAGFSQVYNKPVVTFYSQKDSLSFRFTGNTLNEHATIEIHIKGFNVHKFEDLLLLDGRKIQLDGTKHAAYYISEYSLSPFSGKGIGQVYFRKVRKDNSAYRTAISGTFGFSMPDKNEKTIKVSSGRFDYNIYDTDCLTE